MQQIVRAIDLGLWCQFVANLGNQSYTLYKAEINAMPLAGRRMAPYSFCEKPLKIGAPERSFALPATAGPQGGLVHATFDDFCEIVLVDFEYHHGGAGGHSPPVPLGCCLILLRNL
jgi:hypothetical protein